MKKLLCLCLCLCCLSGSALGAYFVDQSLLENPGAVQRCVALSILSGKPGNRFDPYGYVTRGEMSKMLCQALTGGRGVAMVQEPPFADTHGHWARAYIAYCAGGGIVGGAGDGNFYPDGTVTAAQAGKMLLTALGHNPAREGMLGADWAMTSYTLAQKTGLYDGLSALDPNAPLLREEAAVLLANFVVAPLVTPGSDVSAGVGAGKVPPGENEETAPPQTILRSFYGLTAQRGRLDSYQKQADGSYLSVLDGVSFVSPQDAGRLIGGQVEILFRDENNNGVLDAGETAEAIYSSLPVAENR